MKKLKSTLLVLAAVILLFPSLASAIPVSTELLLLADVSGSISTSEFNLQRNGYAAAFRNADVINAIESSGGIAVCLVYWSTNQAIAADWTHLYDAASANAFADLIAAAPRSSSGSTYMARAMDYGAGLFADNGYEGDRLVVDVSADGTDTASRVQAARDNLAAAGVDMINSLWIGGGTLVDYGVTNVIYGEGAFSWGVNDFEGFEAAVADKIRAEIHIPSPVPEASSLLLLGMGLIGLGVITRKKANARRQDRP